MAISSAIRTGSFTPMTFPSMAILTRLVIFEMTAASRLTEGFMFQ